jgi:proteasome assembly chaperone 3
VPLVSSPANTVDRHLPNDRQEAHLVPSTLLGAGGEREPVAQLYATKIAGFLTMKNPNERRTLVLGLGLRKMEADQVAFLDVLDLVQKVL